MTRITTNTGGTQSFVYEEPDRKRGDPSYRPYKLINNEKCFYETIKGDTVYYDLMSSVKIYYNWVDGEKIYTPGMDEQIAAAKAEAAKVEVAAEKAEVRRVRARVKAPREDAEGVGVRRKAAEKAEVEAAAEIAEARRLMEVAEAAEKTRQVIKEPRPVIKAENRVKKGVRPARSVRSLIFHRRATHYAPVIIKHNPVKKFFKKIFKKLKLF